MKRSKALSRKATHPQQQKTQPSEGPEEPHAQINWRVATPGDRAALRVIHFAAEVVSGQAVNLPDWPYEMGDVLVAEVEGKIIGGILVEEALVATLLGLDRRVAESAGQCLITRILSVAREDGKPLVQIRLPRNVTLNLAVDERTVVGHVQ